MGTLATFCDSCHAGGAFICLRLARASLLRYAQERKNEERDTTRVGVARRFPGTSANRELQHHHGARRILRELFPISSRGWRPQPRKGRVHDTISPSRCFNGKKAPCVLLDTAPVSPTHPSSPRKTHDDDDHTMTTTIGDDSARDLAVFFKRSPRGKIRW